MKILDHLEELRGRLVKIFLAVGLLTFGTFWGADWMLASLLKPSPMIDQSLVSLQPAAVFIQSFRLALLSGLVLALPFVLYQIWSFVSPGLTRPEQKAIAVSLYAGTFLFGIGVLFAYGYVLPKALRFFWTYSEHLGVRPVWSIDYYLNFVLMFLLSFGVAFELPLVIVLLVRFGVLTPSFLSSKRPHCIVAIAILAAALTPPDVVSQLCLGIPLWILFEASLIISRWLS